MNRLTTDNPQTDKNPMNRMGTVVTLKDGLRGKICGYMPKTNEFVLMHDKGGRIEYCKEEDILNEQTNSRRNGL